MDSQHKKLAAGLIIALLILILFIHFSISEHFTNRGDKATAIFNWFKKHGAGSSYTKFRSDMGSSSNIVEYHDVMKLFKERNLTMSNVKSIL